MKFFIVFACALAVASSGYSSPKYYGPQHLAVIGKGGVPIDTAEVQHARAAHFLHKAEAQSGHDYYYEEPSSSYESYNSAPAAQTYGYSTKIVHEQAAYNNQGYGSSYSYEQHVPMIVKGVPVDTIEVQQARAAHLAAQAAQSYKNYQSPSTSNYGSSYGYEQHVPLIVKGVPVHTIEVQHARAAHLAAHAAASTKAYDHYHHY
ncbi:PREDICTED: cuticle protein 5-like [Nicrophorus vespilloides]|uniref:Cuticle protein 5-like n=1 Tax=Nicrophorus vespilloides TaxID=110193 RepID=A0ABM1MLA8_NICVS|nr:PREDICTED: cuticle protein 5-like [Nicrophorus vespilloides]